MASSRKAEGRKVEKEKEKEKEEEVRKRKRKRWKKCKEFIISLSMMGMKKGEKEGKQKKCKTPQSDTNLGEIWELALSPLDSGEDLAKCQCCSRRTTKKNGGSAEIATRSAEQKKQMDGGNTQKVEAAKRRGQNGNEERSKTIEVYPAQWAGMEHRDKVFVRIQRKV